MSQNDVVLIFFYNKFQNLKKKEKHVKKKKKETGSELHHLKWYLFSYPWPRWPPTSATACSSLSVSSVTSSEKSSIGAALAIFRFLFSLLLFESGTDLIYFAYHFENVEFCFLFCFVFRDTLRSVWDSKISTFLISIFVFRLGIFTFQ